MKAFKALRNVTEAHYSDAHYSVGPMGQDNSTDTPDVAVFDVGHPDSIRRINAYLGSAAAKPCIDPSSVLRQIQRKLAIVGLQFTIPSRSWNGMATNVPEAGKESVTDYPLTYLGGRTGVLDNNYNIGSDDGMSHRTGAKLRLRVKYVTQESGLTLVVPRIEQSAAPMR